MTSLMTQTINCADINNIEYILNKHVTIYFFWGDTICSGNDVTLSHMFAANVERYATFLIKRSFLLFFFFVLRQFTKHLMHCVLLNAFIMQYS